MNNVYLLQYEDDFLFHKESERLLKEINASKEDIEKIDIEESGLEVFLNSANTIPFLVDKRIIIAETESLFKTKNDFDEDLLKKVITYLEKPLESTYIIFKTRSTDKTSKVFNVVKNYHTYKKIESLDSKDLANMIVQRLSSEEVSINGDAKDELLNRCADNAERIDNELEKLLSYKDKGEIVTKEDIELLVANDIERNASYGTRDQSAVMASSEDTGRSTIGWP